MTRFVQLGILMLALLGLVGQATAHAMARGHTPTTTMNSMQMASNTMSCNDTQPAESDRAPCKKVGLQCAAALGCASPYMIEADGPASDYVALEPLKSIVGRVNALDDRTVAPEPEPPSFLI